MTTIGFHGVEIVQNDRNIVENGHGSGELAHVWSWSALCERVGDSGLCVLLLGRSRLSNGNETGAIRSSESRRAMNDGRHVGRGCLVAELGDDGSECGMAALARAGINCESTMADPTVVGTAMRVVPFDRARSGE